MVYKSLLLPLLATGFLLYSFPATSHTNDKSQAVARKNQQSGYFVENKGQIHDQSNALRPDIDYKLATGSGLTIFLGGNSIHYQWAKPVEKSGHSGQIRTVSYGKGEAGEPTTALSPAFQMYRMDVELVGANPNPEVITEQQQGFYERYYPKDVTARSFKKITYKDVYPKIDWIFYFNASGQLEHDFLVRPGANPSDIKIKYSGASNLSINKDGSLTAITDLGTITEKAPHSYDQQGRVVPSRFKLDGNILSFATDSYAGSLTIDPTLEWGTYFGGSDYDQINGITSDNEGNVYTTGFTLSTANIATTGGFQITYGGSNVGSVAGDAFLAKFNCNGEAAWATYYGGTAAEVGWNVITDKSDNVFMSAFTNNYTGTINLATTGSFQPNSAGGSGELLLVKFNSAGDRIWATYFGGSGNENSATQPAGLAIDETGNIYLSGTTNSTSGIATSLAHQTTLGGGTDAFIVKWDSSGSRIWSSYYGGTGTDIAIAMACDKNNNVFLTGTTTSLSQISTTGAHQASNAGSQDGFLVKFDSSGSRLWATYYGGSGNQDATRGIYCDSSNNVYIAGRTNSSSGISTTGSYKEIFGGLFDGFLAKFDSDGTRLWGTYFGGANQGSLLGYSCLSGNKNGYIYVGGFARASDSMSTPGSFQEINAGLDDGVLGKFSEDGDPEWITYYGGGGTDCILSVNVDIFNNVYCAGVTGSTTGIASSGSHQEIFGGSDQDGFLFKFEENPNYPAPDTIFGNTLICAGSANLYHIEPVSGAVAYNWTLPTGWAGSSSEDTIEITSGLETDTIRVSAVFACGTSIEKILIVSIVPSPIINSTSASLCANDSAVLSIAMPLGTSIHWQRDNIDIAGATDTAYTATETGNYRVIISAGSCVDTSAAVTVHANPEPVITQTGSVLSTTESFPGYQWNFNDAPITGATGTTYNATIDGSYSVTVTDINGCTGTSAQVEIGSTGIFDPKGTSQVSVYPNPAMEAIYIKSTIPVTVSLTTIDGKILIESADTSQLNIKGLADALYFLRISDHNGNLIKIVKVVKQTSRQ